MGWTKEQEQAITARGANLLVAAAAGSGKTAVFVERIVKMVCEEDYEIDKILVMTFTKAAAAEMKERIGNRLLEEGIQNPDNQKLQGQLAYIHRAPISTIHSFCMELLREHFHLISLDPNFRIGEEGEIALLKEQVLDEMMEECYGEREEEFLNLVEAYSYGKDDRTICEMILRLFDFSVSHPEPEQWLDHALQALETGEKGPAWLSQVMEYGDRILKDALSYIEEAVKLSEQDVVLEEKYVPQLRKDADGIRTVLQAEDYERRVEAFSGFSFGRMPAIRKKEGINLTLMDEVKELRDEVKTMVTGLLNDCYLSSVEEIRQETMVIKPYAKTLIGLVKRFSEKFLSCKLEKNMLEFNDLEHFSLKLLVEKYEEGKVVKTALAQELSDRYQAVFTDEYQDSNLIQEVLLRAVSREEDGNRFMVGDIKQSIYKFRMARPELFLEKYEAYGEEGLNRKIELKNNFRSRPEVLYSINYFFYQIMKPSLGDVLYDKNSALTPPEMEEEKEQAAREKEIQKEKEKEIGNERLQEEQDAKRENEKRPIAQEILLLNMAGTEGEDGTSDKKTYTEEETGEEYTAIELEARMVAKRIKELTTEQIESKIDSQKEPHIDIQKEPQKDLQIDLQKEPQENHWEYKDMVILLRTMEGWSQIFEEVLTMEGIPVHTESKTGYFDTFEIRVLLNLLSVVDNIYQDIPMAAVMRSPIGGFCGEELAKIRSLVLQERRQEDSFYDEMIFYLETGEEKELKEKIERLLTLLHELREEKTWLSLTELIWSAMNKTGYYHMAGSMPNGDQRMANIRMFLEKARQYEKTSFKGVFHFLQYIEKLRSYQIDYGEASILSEEANVVRIMSIHKSKGLEFPVVFLSGLGKQFNFMDRNQRMLLHPDYYLGLDCIYLDTRSKKVSQQKKMISRQLVLSMLGEELRVLYVAMTRAKEKLIMTGAVKDFHDFIWKYGKRPKNSLGFSAMIKAKNYLQWIFPALCRHPVMDSWKESRGIEIEASEYFSVKGEEPCFRLQVVAPFQLFGQEMKRQYEEMKQKESLIQWIKEGGSREREEEIAQAFSWVYPKEAELSARSKWTVSQLKEEQTEEPLFVSDENEDEWKSFMKAHKNDSVDEVVSSEFILEGEVQADIEKIAEEKEKLFYEKKERKMPAFLQKKEEILTGASRGTAVHKLMEELSFEKVRLTGLEQALSELVETGRYPGEYLPSLPMKKIERFYGSALGKRLAKAEKQGRLYKEVQFMMGVPMKEMEPETNSEELVLVQGVIDLYMEEEDGLILLDYKTDYVKRGEEKKLLARYERQLRWYERALEQMTGKKVKEVVLYSFSLDRAFKL